MKADTAVIGVFANRESAQAAVRNLRNAGFEETEIGLIARHGDEPTVDRLTNSKMAEGSLIGAVTGAGAAALWSLGIATLGLPAIGPVIAGGIFMALLASAGGGAAVGTLVGSLIGLGIPEEDATFYENEVKAGRYLVTVTTDPYRRAEVDAIFNRFGGYDRSTMPSGDAVVPQR
jgi:hypothetical protein